MPMPEGYEDALNPHNPFRIGGLEALLHQVAEPVDPKSHEDVDLTSVDSILAHAEYVPEGWSRVPLASLIRQRIELGIDENIHDATFWLSEFECPRVVNGEIAHDEWTEMTVVVAALFGQDPSKLPTSERKIDTLFTSEVMANAYRAMRAGYVSNSAQVINNLQAGNWGRAGVMDGELARLIANCENHGLVVSKEKQAEALQALGEMAGVRQRYGHEAQGWLRNHGTTPREKLVKAWKARSSALKFGVADNPNAIIAWEKANGIKVIFSHMEDEGALPANIDHEELDKHQAFIQELSRVYEGRTVIEALSGFIEKYSPEVVFPAASTELSDGSHMEVLSKNDPRIFTVGGDTGCCMTPTGMGRSYIEAAYSDPRVSIMALYDPEGDLAAHSVIFTNPEYEPSALVIDNIETNQGRNRDRVAKLYQEFFSTYLQRPELAGFDTVILGMHSDEKFEIPLKTHSRIPTIMERSDAQRQAVLYERNPDFDPAEFVPMSVSFRQIYPIMEKAIYGPDANGAALEAYESASTASPGIHSYVIQSKEGSPVGYVIAYETSEYVAAGRAKDQQETVIYIDDLGILPQHQGSGYGEKALTGMLKLAERKQKPLLFHVRDHSSWPIIESKQPELEARGFKVEVLEHDSNYFSQGHGARLVRLTRATLAQSVV